MLLTTILFPVSQKCYSENRFKIDFSKIATFPRTKKKISNLKSIIVMQRNEPKQTILIRTRNKDSCISHESEREEKTTPKVTNKKEFGHKNQYWNDVKEGKSDPSVLYIWIFLTSGASSGLYLSKKSWLIVINKNFLVMKRVNKCSRVPTHLINTTTIISRGNDQRYSVST